ncbi:MAG: hypothetical protein JWN43_4954 [Gammaproteobacteria bacterium]|nr:hypothetical protein [Gammaproteobacteria bacterium]
MLASRSVSMIFSLAAALLAFAPARAEDPSPVAPAAFFPAGMLGVQIGSSWETSKRSPSLGQMTCQPNEGAAETFDEVCFFSTSGRVAGAPTHDGFIVRKGDRVVLIGTGIAIKNADDPLAETVMRDFESQVHARFQHTGADVLFVNLPERRLSATELARFSQTAPVLLVELEPKENELAVFYGYLAPVNAFSALTSE